MKSKTLYVGIMSREEYQKRTIAIAKGTYKPKPHEPKVWFESIKSLALDSGRDFVEKLYSN